MGDHDTGNHDRAITTYEGWAKRNPTQSNTNGRRDTGCAAPVIGTVNGNLPRHGKTALVSVSMLLTRLRQDEDTREIPETSNPTSPDHRYSQPFDTICETIGTLGTSNTVIGLAVDQRTGTSNAVSHHIISAISVKDHQCHRYTQAFGTIRLETPPTEPTKSTPSAQISADPSEHNRASPHPYTPGAAGQSWSSGRPAFRGTAQSSRGCGRARTAS
ncbi:hypothetical protein CQR47_1178 [Bifidobacterium thermophilum]|uniref:Uncharacterized protein n=1 Tax=Bifidobacterium thermophilum TaxID=33905 RepID=A0A2N3QK45_9BIFI|nr:hypothetical protein CQR47_1178 [Bifidobacterium thermophilum]